MREFLQYQVHTEPVLAQDEAVTESRWHRPWSEPVRQKIAPAVAIALMASGLFFTPQQAGEVVTADKWFAWLSEPVRLKPGLETALQRPFTIDPVALTLPESAIPEDRWHQPWSEPIRLDLKHPLRTSLQQATTIDPAAMTVPETVTEDRWHQPWSEPVVKGKIGLAAARQQAFIFTQAFFGEQITYDKWGYQWSEPIRLDLRTSRLRADEQRAFTISPEPIPLKPKCYGYIIV